MPDISMCSGAACARKNQCYRYRARTSGEWQCWFGSPPLEPDGTCKAFWDIGDRKNLRTIEECEKR